MNERGHPETLVAAHPSNLNALKSGVHSPRVRAACVAELRQVVVSRPILEVAAETLEQERVTLRHLAEALVRDLETHGVSTRSGAARPQIDQGSAVQRQLTSLGRVASGSRANHHDRCPGSEAEHLIDVLRERLCVELARRNLLDLDLQARGVSTPRGGERRQVRQRVSVSRDLVRIILEIRSTARQTDHGSERSHHPRAVGLDIAFDDEARVSDRLKAVELALQSPAAPRETTADEIRIRHLTEDEVEAELRELEAERARYPELERGHGLDAAPSNERAGPERAAPAPDEDGQRCLDLLRLFAGGGREASPRERMRAARLHLRFGASSGPTDWIHDEIWSWSEEELDRDVESLLDAGDEPHV